MVNSLVTLLETDVKQSITEILKCKHILNIRPTIYPKLEYLCTIVMAISKPNTNILFVHSNDEDKAKASKLLSAYQYLDCVSYKSLSKIKKITDKQFKKDYKLIVFNEAHLSGADSVEASLKSIFRLNPRAIRVGITSTPIRYDKKDICNLFFGGNKLPSYDLQDAVQSNVIPDLYYVCGLKSATLKQYLLSKTDDKQIQREVYNIVNASSIIDKTLKNVYHERPDILHIVVFIPGGTLLEAASKELMQLLSESFKDYNIFVKGAVRGQIEARNTSKTGVNSNSIASLKQAYIIVNPNLNKGIGFNADILMLLRSTTSQKVYIKQIGTILKAGQRNTPVIIDFVDSLNTKLVYQNTNTGGGHGPSYPNLQPVDVKKITVKDYRVTLQDVLVKLNTGQHKSSNNGISEEQSKKTEEKVDSKTEQLDKPTDSVSEIQKQVGINDLYWNRFIDLDGKTVINKPIIQEIMRLRTSLRAPAEIISKMTGASYVAVLLVLSLHKEKLQSSDYSTFIGPIPRLERSNTYSKEYIRQSMMKIRENSKLDLSSFKQN